MTINKGRLLKTAGWVTIGIGLYIIGLGSIYDESDYQRPRKYSDNIIDAEFKIID